MIDDHFEEPAEAKEDGKESDGKSPICRCVRKDEEKYEPMKAEIPDCF